MRSAKQGTAHAGRRGTARPEYHDGRLLGRKDWKDRQAIARRVAPMIRTLEAPGSQLEWTQTATKEPSHYPLPFDNMDISIWSEICQLFDTFTRRGPVNLKLVNL